MPTSNMCCQEGWATANNTTDCADKSNDCL